MPRLLLGILLALSTLPGRAVATWLPDGSPVCTPCNGGNPVVAPDGAGCVFVVWQDGRAGFRIYAQHLTANGDIAPGWPATGLPVGLGPAPQTNPAVVADGQGGFFASWMDSRNSASAFDIYAQHLRGDGTLAPGWPPNGVPVTQEPGNDQQGVLTLDSEGGLFLAWSTPAPVVWAQHLSASGAPALGWPSDGIIACSLPSLPTSIIGDGTGGALLAWTDARRGGSIPDGYDAYGLRLTAQGSIAPGWTENGLLLAPGEWKPILLPDLTGGFYMASASPSPYAFDANYYLHRFTIDGAPAPGWPTGGVLVCSAPGDRWGLLAALDGTGGVSMDWYDYRLPGDDVYGSRVLATGTLAPGWPADGLRVGDPGQPNEFNFGLAPDGLGGAYMSWEGYFPSYIQHVTAEGLVAPGWPQYGIQLASTCNQFTPQVVPDGAGGAIAVWEERGLCARNGLFAQRFVPDGPVPVLVSLVSADAQADRVSLAWQGPGAGSLVAVVYRRSATGQWARLGSATADGADRLRYEDRDVTSGARYGYRLGYRMGETEQFSAESWVEVPAAARLALAGFQPNPAPGGALQIAFALPGAEPATLELLDVSGRRIVTREVGSLGAGAHVLRLDDATGLNPGVYWVRLEQAGRGLLAKGIVSR